MRIEQYYNHGDRVRHLVSGMEGTVDEPGYRPMVNWDNGSRIQSDQIKLIGTSFIDYMINKLTAIAEKIGEKFNF